MAARTNELERRVRRLHAEGKVTQAERLNVPRAEWRGAVFFRKRSADHVDVRGLPVRH